MDLARLPQIQAWTDDLGEFDLRNFLLSAVSVAEASAVVSLLNPTFIEYRGCVLLESAFTPAPVDSWFEHFDGNLTSVESMVNHVHLWDSFNPQSPEEHQALTTMARYMATTWHHAAQAQFPARIFTTDFSDDPDDYGPTVTLYTVRDAGIAAPLQGELKVLLFLDWYDGPLEGVLRSGDDATCWYFKLLAERRETSVPDDRLFTLSRLSDSDSAVLRTESDAGRLHTWPPTEDLPEAQRIVDNLLSTPGTPHLILRPSGDFKRITDVWTMRAT